MSYRTKDWLKSMLDDPNEFRIYVTAANGDDGGFALILAKYFTANEENFSRLDFYFPGYNTTSTNVGHGSYFHFKVFLGEFQFPVHSGSAMRDSRSVGTISNDDSQPVIQFIGGPSTINLLVGPMTKTYEDQYDGAYSPAVPREVKVRTKWYHVRDRTDMLIPRFFEQKLRKVSSSQKMIGMKSIGWRTNVEDDEERQENEESLTSLFEQFFKGVEVF